MEIRKADSKGRLTVGENGMHYFVTEKPDGEITLRPVPTVDEVPEGYEPAEVSEMKNEILNTLYEFGLDEEAADFIELSDQIGEAVRRFVLIN